MPRSLSAAIQAQVSAQQTTICYLVEFVLSSTVRATDFYTDLVYDGNSYSAGGSFLQINQTQENLVDLTNPKIKFRFTLPALIISIIVARWSYVNCHACSKLIPPRIYQQISNTCFSMSLDSCCKLCKYFKTSDLSSIKRRDRKNLMG